MLSAQNQLLPLLESLLGASPVQGGTCPKPPPHTFRYSLTPSPSPLDPPTPVTTAPSTPACSLLLRLQTRSGLQASALAAPPATWAPPRPCAGLDAVLGRCRQAQLLAVEVGEGAWRPPLGLSASQCPVTASLRTMWEARLNLSYPQREADTQRGPDV